MITLNQIEKAQAKWAQGIVTIGAFKDDKNACETATDLMINELYAFDLGNVLFKPTKAAKQQFRLNFEGAKSYFIGGNSKYKEDKGFALNPWSLVEFDNVAVVLNESSASAMGNYFFTDLNGKKVKVEYSFGYIANEKGNLKINLHHSSLPFVNV